MKTINDTYGHEKGNEAIQGLCSLICKTFKHSPVYRIGGDEFVVILKNNDYENRQTLCEKFNTAMKVKEDNESLKLWERISAALGCEVYDPQLDQDVESVFKRADQTMYIRKKEMKEGKGMRLNERIRI